MKILVLNCGSSSLKYQLIDMKTETVLAKGNYERIGEKEAFLTHKVNGEKYVIRLKSPGNFNKKIEFNDLVRGKIVFPENDIDVILVKSDGIPVYHFANVIDDHLMRTTHILRGEEWLSSTPVHLQLFEMLKFKAPRYAHLGLVMKIDEDGTRRKLSKRKDPEAAVSYYHERGIPAEAVKLYLMTLANSNFEEWLNQNIDKGIDDFTFNFKLFISLVIHRNRFASRTHFPDGQPAKAVHPVGPLC